ncbi:MAG: hypothetical protein LC114_19865 [Bryobacterales bacterium]|nr:hypothetical protein [Bryobacterales bacterium]
MQLSFRRRGICAAVRVLLIAGLMTLPIAAQKLEWNDLRAAVERMVHLRVPDAAAAARLRKIQSLNAIPASTVETAAEWDAGPLTQRELRRLTEQSASQPDHGALPELRHHPRRMPSAANGEAGVIVELVRLYAQDYSESIPNFLCFRNTRFMKDNTPFGRWKLMTELREKLSHTGEDDEHEIVAIDGVRVRDATIIFNGGLTVSGEFGNVMRRIFDPDTQTTFTWMGQGENADRIVLGIQVRQEHSTMRISSGDGEEVVMGYSGEVHASRSTGQIFRIRLTMDELPKGHAIRGATWDIHYGPVKVEERELLLPAFAAVEAYQHGRFVRNEATYTDYQKYSADSNIRYEQP